MNLDDLPGELTIALRRPVTFGDQPYGELRLREPTGSELERASSKPGIEGDVYLIFLVSGVPIGAVDQIGSRDLKKATNFLGAFNPDFPAPGDPEALPDELTLALRRPIGPDRDITELKLREPTAGDRKKVVGFSGTAATMELVSLVAGVPSSACGQLVARDLRKAAIYLAGFMSDGPETGARA